VSKVTNAQKRTRSIRLGKQDRRFRRWHSQHRSLYAEQRDRAISCAAAWRYWEAACISLGCLPPRPSTREKAPHETESDKGSKAC
jgi:hypothetical protein